MFLFKNTLSALARMAVVGVIPGLIGGCSHGLRVDENFGASARAMVAGQIENPQASVTIYPMGAQGMDGERAISDFITHYRQKQSDKQERGEVKLILR